MIYNFKKRPYSDVKTCANGWKCCNNYNMSPRSLKKIAGRIERRRLNKLTASY